MSIICAPAGGWVGTLQLVNFKAQCVFHGNYHIKKIVKRLDEQ